MTKRKPLSPWWGRSIGILLCFAAYLYLYPKTFPGVWRALHTIGLSPGGKVLEESAHPQAQTIAALETRKDEKQEGIPESDRKKAAAFGDVLSRFLNGKPQSDATGPADESTLLTTEKRRNEIFPGVYDTFTVSAPSHETKIPGMPIAWTLPSGIRPGKPSPFLAFDSDANEAVARLNPKVNGRYYEVSSREWISVKHFVFPKESADTWHGSDLEVGTNILKSEKGKNDACQSYISPSNQYDTGPVEEDYGFENTAVHFCSYAGVFHLTLAGYRQGEGYVIHWDCVQCTTNSEDLTKFIKSVHWID